MSAPKFTPGPWYAVPDAHSEYRGSDVDLRVRAETSTVALVPEDGNGDANAHLIAAAPDLYEALAKIPQRYMDEMDAHTPGASQLIRAALAKAVQP